MSEPYWPPDDATMAQLAQFVVQTMLDSCDCDDPAASCRVHDLSSDVPARADLKAVLGRLRRQGVLPWPTPEQAEAIRLVLAKIREENEAP